ncbi:MAG: UDP-N-acetylmuramate--L-alanine ligase [Candidatus Omnitrophica bacterium CG11_big_fil_rev_8_21_14_0_20_45_26]|uniref:UDP-N-acetylmuramate--L-alanine ligase n=1 Tax=Candidatus Abzuiibacterium crystallinum TaxID=1974748 RepID=A0A2H0LS24_9BACT|nr:MAG: UDP-N-acetylmuramate--L-alanine ligase [Candidatus Omnitrophica bacterium CG11_big_fil_rev_8_21_14_0_20_45_26]PIW64310.1 MAG: UDP-N-acetylmuramate--L-alanine ligase [Candidatus Omnitrophica bacterium CG12_big_fil_rev_8_21_14_0_65_45_16]
MTATAQTDVKLQDLLKAGNRAYLIGIGGVGMSGLAKVLKSRGLHVAGSDQQESETTRDLIQSGIPVYIGHDLNHVHHHDFAIYSSAITISNQERRETILRGIPSFHRADVLSALMNQSISIAVTGTHGKTTTSAMLSTTLTLAGLKPTCLIGGKVKNFGTNIKLGDPHFMVAEVDESDKSHLLYRPDYLVLTNLEEDHLDIYENFDNLKQSFVELLKKVGNSSHIIYSGHDVCLKELVQVVSKKTSFGLSKQFDYGAENITIQNLRTQFDLFELGQRFTRVTLQVAGKHNVMNALATVATLRVFGLSMAKITQYLSEFVGVKRRLDVILSLPQITVIDDYAHHPTEIAASLQAIKTLQQKPLVAVFQPHRYSRMQHIGHQFPKVLALADRVIITDIYAAGETNTYETHAQDLEQMMKSADYPNAVYVPKNELIDYLVKNTGLEGVMAFIGAGDITEVAHEFADRITNPDPV